MAGHDRVDKSTASDCRGSRGPVSTENLREEDDTQSVYAAKVRIGSMNLT